jgi:hypothetical protein
MQVRIVLLVSTDCYMLLLHIYAVAGGTVVHALARETVLHAVTGGTEEHTAADCFFMLLLVGLSVLRFWSD